jgi:hypothetical protein
MTNEEFQASFAEIVQKLSETKLMMQQETAPNLAIWFGILSRADGDIQFLLVRLRAVQGLPSKWRRELAGNDVAERCASELEAVLDQRSDPES